MPNNSIARVRCLHL